jgi:hypothetical protein
MKEKIMENLPLRSPCYECEFGNEDKNNERCRSCEKRIAYAKAMQLIPSETSNNVEEERISSEVIKNIMTVQEIDVNYKIVLQDIKDIQEEIPRRKGRKRGQKPSKDLYSAGRIQTHINFNSEYFDVHRDLVNIAKLEHRALSMQAIYFIKEGITKYKENHNG